MKKLVALPLLFASVFFCWSTPYATSITTSAVSELNGYIFKIDDNDAIDNNPKNFTATLQNTGSASVSLLYQIAMNMNAVLGTDFSISFDVGRDWEFSKGSSNLKFNYVAATNKDSLQPGNILQFIFQFNDTFIIPNDPFSIWTDAGKSSAPAPGIAGDFQVAAAFSGTTDATNLFWLGSNWDSNGGGGGAPVPEPATLLMLSTGLTGIAIFCRKKLV